MRRGTLTAWFEKGFGFIIDGREQFFLHVHNLENPFLTPVKGDVIEFEPGEPWKTGKLPCAMKARIVSPLDGGAK